MDGHGRKDRSDIRADGQCTKQDGLRRTLKSRHLEMISIGGAIGTGVFLLSGEAVSTGGPGYAVLSYIVMGTIVYELYPLSRTLFKNKPQILDNSLLLNPSKWTTCFCK